MWQLGSEARSRGARDRAEEALIRFALLAQEHVDEFVVIGGLNPDFLAPSAPTPHLGTTDVDLLFELGFAYDRDDLDFSWLDRALSEGGFRPQSASGWRWTGSLGDTLMRLDLLCDVYDSPGQPVLLPGASEAAAQNLPGPASALHDPIERDLLVPEAVRAQAPNAPDTVRMRFASLAGYLAAKSAALLARDQQKDAYDLAFVMMFAPGGPSAAAAAVAGLEAPAHLPRLLATVRSAVGGRTACGPSLALSPQRRPAVARRGR